MSLKSNLVPSASYLFDAGTSASPDNKKVRNPGKEVASKKKDNYTQTCYEIDLLKDIFVPGIKSFMDNY